MVADNSKAYGRMNFISLMDLGAVTGSQTGAYIDLNGFEITGWWHDLVNNTATGIAINFDTRLDLPNGVKHAKLGLHRSDSGGFQAFGAANILTGSPPAATINPWLSSGFGAVAGLPAFLPQPIRVPNMRAVTVIAGGSVTTLTIGVVAVRVD